MWLGDGFPADGGLHQGDVLLKVPLIGRQVGEPGEQVAEPKETDVLVVSQCCTVQQQRVIGLAPLHTLRLDKQRADLLASLTPRLPNSEGGRFSVNQFLLDPHPSLVAPPRAKVAWLNEMHFLEVGSDPDWLLKRRILSMTPQARVWLRTKVSLHWGRPTEEDRAALGDEVNSVVNL